MENVITIKELTDANGELLPEILTLLGFQQEKCECKVTKEFHWHHPENPMDQMYYHILTPYAIKAALIEIGHNQFREKVLTKIENMECDELESVNDED